MGVYLVIKSQWTQNAYMSYKRPPGRLTLVVEKNPRGIMWSCMNRYLQKCSEMDVQPFVMRRFMFLQQLRRGEHNGMFTHIFVDEYQDCTPADFEIFYRLLEDPNNLFVCGDLAQSLHLGRSSSSPKKLPRWSSKQGKFEHLPLDGSFRLPFRVSEAIQPLSVGIKRKRSGDPTGEDEVISEQLPYKGAPPGARPILVYAYNVDQMAEKLAQIFDEYVEYDLDKISILDKDVDLKKALFKLGRRTTESDTIKRIKGMEKRCVVWSTRIMDCGADEVEEHVYTILSRTSRLLIIALFDDMPEVFKSIIGSFQRDRLICWDSSSEDCFETLSNAYTLQSNND